MYSTDNQLSPAFYLSEEWSISRRTVVSICILFFYGYHAHGDVQPDPWSFMIQVPKSQLSIILEISLGY